MPMAHLWSKAAGGPKTDNEVNMPVSKHNRKGQPRPRKIKPSTIAVQLARLHMAVKAFLEYSEAELYEELRLNEQLFWQYAEEDNSYEVVLRYIYFRDMRETLYKLAGEYGEDPDHKGRIETVLKRVDQIKAKMDECLEWPEGWKDGEICLASE